MAEPAPEQSTAFRRLMGRWATGVSIVTAHHAGTDAGLTVNSLVSVSLHPPSVLISLTHDADTTGVIQADGQFAVNFLAVDQRALSERFARMIPLAEKFAQVAVHRGATGAPLLDGALGVLECRVVGWIPQFDHVLIVGEVIAQAAGADTMPLLFFEAMYGETAGPRTVRLPARPG